MRWSWDDFAAGVRGIALALPGPFSVSVIAGVAAVGAGFSALQAYVYIGLTFAGASQLAAMELLAGGSAVAVAVVTALVINARFAVFSASLAPHFREAPARWRWLAGVVLSTPATMVSLARFAREGDDGDAEGDESERDEDDGSGGDLHHLSYYFGAALALWATWQVGTLTGVFVGAELPTGLGLEFVVPLVFVGLLFPTINDRGTALAALVGGVGAVAGAGLPLGLGFIVGTAVGVLAGEAVDHLTDWEVA
jgi:predicted branched-subunit amino acid permease